MRTISNGAFVPTATSQLLQLAGISPGTAELVDGGLSLTGAGWGGAMIARAPSLVSKWCNFQLPAEANSGWVLPKNGGGALINSRWYTEHALERMAPDTPQVMAILEERCLERARVAGYKPQTQEFREWLLQGNAPDPRNIPPMIIEAEIACPGSTGLRVILNDRKDVITVIPRK